MFTRKEFLGTGLLSAFSIPSLLSGRPRSSESNPSPSRNGEARNVIFLVVDGMSSGTLAMGDLMTRRQLGRASNWIDLYENNRARRSLMDMASSDSFVTDSAAAASSWGSGRRIPNGGVNWSEEGKPLRSVVPIFRDAGKATGLVTTTRITHATPAGFAAAVPSRNLEDEIASQYLEIGVDLLMGGGTRHFTSTGRRDGRDLLSEFRQAGYPLVSTRDEMLAQADGIGLLGLFYDSHLPYTVDHRTVPQLREGVPTLAEMSRTALERLSRHPDGFLLQIEGGRVDHAAHGNDPSGLVFDMMAFDDAIGEVLRFAEGRDDTLVIITTDHSNANPGVNGAGLGYTGSPAMFDNLQSFRHSNEWIADQLDSDPSAARILEVVEEATRLQITRDEADMLVKSFKNELVTPYRPERVPSAVLGAIQANYVGINWIGGVHTSDYVELAAMGPGADRLNGFTRNTELFDLMVDMAGVRDFVDRP